MLRVLNIARGVECLTLDTPAKHKLSRKADLETDREISHNSHNTQNLIAIYPFRY